MPTEYTSKYHPEFFRDLDKLDKGQFIAVNKKLKQIRKHPRRFKHLSGGGNIYSVRVGKYRIIYEVKGKVILFLVCEHRGVVYKVYVKRLHSVKEKLGK